MDNTQKLTIRLSPETMARLKENTRRTHLLDSHTRLQGSHGRVEHNLFENIQGAAIQIEAGCETCWGSCSSPTAGTAWRRKT